MKLNTELDTDLKGLTDSEVTVNRKLYGSNDIRSKQSTIWPIIKSIVFEPMFILLLSTGVIYLLTKNIQDALLILVGILAISIISFVQERKSRSAIDAINKLSAGKAVVIRNGEYRPIDSELVVTGDLIVLEEGNLAAADGIIVRSNDLSVDESVISGESLPLYKNTTTDNSVYGASMVMSGSAVVRVTAVGKLSKYGQIGNMVRNRRSPKSGLQRQVNSFLKSMLIFGAIAFVIVVTYNFFLSKSIIAALFTGLTLAMSIIPEEIPVAVTAFQALGAFKLLSKGIIVKQPQFVESLGSATVICVDKTGTLTRNLMELASFYDADSGRLIDVQNTSEIPARLLETAMWASEETPFDPMEKAIHNLYAQTCASDRRPLFRQVHEYPLGGIPPLMTHIVEDSLGNQIIAAKGAPEALLNQSDLPDIRKKLVLDTAASLANDGYRVLGVGIAKKVAEWPATQQEFEFEFIGMLAFRDPLKDGIRNTIESFYKAGLKVKMITGDHPGTAIHVAEEAGFHQPCQLLTGPEVLALSDSDLVKKAQTTDIFARMLPEAKVKVIDALVSGGEIVAMTGDGVNDAPSLKAAHIGIAMGMRGNEVAKQASAIVITDDDLDHMVDAIKTGRTISGNLKKSIRYILSIHIPIILIVTIPLLFRWPFTTFFTPVHILFLELIMGPTCSIIFEGEPSEPGIMSRGPEPQKKKLLETSELLLSIVQGIAITAGCLLPGYWFMTSGADENEVRTIIFITLLISNILLTMVNRSFNITIFSTIRYRNRLMNSTLLITLGLVAIILLWTVPRKLFLLAGVPVGTIGLCILSALLCTLWIEPFKLLKKKFF